MMVAATVMCSVQAQAQTDRREVRGGNRDFKKADYAAAEIDYKKALVKDSTSVAAQYNLANTLYQLENWQEAEKYAGKALDSLSRSPRAADAFFNNGDIYLQQRRWSEAIEAFKESLRRNPGDMDAKSNLAYAQKMLQNEQQQQQDQQNNQNQDQNQNDDQQNQDQNKDQNQDQNQDNQDQNKDQNKDQNQDDKQNPDQNQNDNQNNPDQNQNPDNNDNQNQNGQQPKITPDAAEQMLQAIQDKENETQDKVKKEKAAALKSRQKEKNW